MDAIDMKEYEENRITTANIVHWAMAGFGTLILASVAWIGSNTAEIPVIKTKIEQQTSDLVNIKLQIVDVPVMKVQMDNISKQFDRIDNAEALRGREIEEMHIQIMENDRRLKEVERHSGKNAD